MCQDVYDKVKKIIKEDACMKFYDAYRSLYMKTDALSVKIGPRLVQVRNDMNCSCDKVLKNVTLPNHFHQQESIKC